MIKERKFIFYLDGDNVQVPTGIELLHEDDEIHIFYNTGNKSFNFEKRKAITASAKCSVDYQVIQASANAVDFAIAVEACKRYAENKDEENMYILVSKDKHFEVIIRELNRIFQLKSGFYRVASIEEAMSKFFLLKVKNKDNLSQALIGNFGEIRGVAILKSLCSLFSNQEIQQNQNTRVKFNSLLKRKARDLFPKKV